MSKTLYISDLDGTLLNSSAAVSDYTRNVLNEFIGEGGFFSVATARTAATALHILDGVKLNMPVVLMNGVCIYDTEKKEYIHIEKLSRPLLEKMFGILGKYRLSGFLFSINNSVLETFYENLDSENARKFYEERTRRFGKYFTKTDSFMACLDRNAVYYSVTDRYEILSPICDELRKTEGLHVEFYRDVYAPDYWYMEVCSEKASKYNAVRYIREKYGFDKIVGFGDNLNDIPLFEACDEAYAVSNAKEEVCSAACGMIPSNDDNGVARKINALLKKPL